MAILMAGSSNADMLVKSGSASTSGATKPAALQESILNNVSGGLSMSYPVAPQTEFWFSVNIYLAYIAGSSGDHIVFYDTAYSTSIPVLKMFINTSAQLQMLAWNGSSYVALASAAGTISFATVLKMDIHFKLDDTVGVCDIYVGGALQFTFSGDTNLIGSGFTGVDAFGFTTTSAIRNCTTSGWIFADEDTRAMLIAQSKPSGAGGVSQWTGAYTAIDETNYSDADYIDSVTLLDYSTFAKTALPVGWASGFTVKAVVFAVRGQVGDIAGSDIAVAARISSTNYEMSKLDMGAAADMRFAIEPLNPATGTAWTYTTINAAEFGVRHVAP